MVIKFTSNSVNPPAMIYMGVDKVENEDLIKYGWPEDVWFHVDKLSSAHVYLRLPPGMSIDSIPAELLEDCCQLVKQNSIEGCKLNNVAIVYTMWSNLKKTGDMAVGQVGFHSHKQVKHTTVEKKINEIVNRLEKTRWKGDIDYKQERDDRDAQERRKQKKIEQERKDQEKKQMLAQMEKKKIENYEDVDWDAGATRNDEDPGNLSDDFM
uniref:Coiled-coil domain-containing protein 25 n=1 Tax=Caenorhabditis tropicalis TaxID=1561998 RepID=A0A1I7TSF3_9PELO